MVAVNELVVVPGACPAVTTSTRAVGGAQPGCLTADGIETRPGQARDPSVPRGTDRPGIRIAAVERGDAEAVLAMLGRCSSTTLYHRFHGITDGVAHATQVLADIGQDAYGAWCGDRCVGLASLAADGDGSTHVGVLVEDGWQRQGVGSALLAALLNRAGERQLASVVADVLADDHFILPLLARIGPMRTSFACGSHTVRLDIRAPAGPIASIGCTSVLTRGQPCPQG